MNEVLIYMEGGGDGPGSAQQKADLRIGMDALLDEQKQAARVKRLRWRTIPSGGRQQTFEAFHRALTQAGDETLLVLLVDSEDAIAAEANNADAANAEARRQHLTLRDHWDLSDADPMQIHLMVRCMEAWIVADPDAMAAYYGAGFHAKSLPHRQNMEDEPKEDLYQKLRKATEKTQKGAYAKIKHASKLLERIEPAKVGKKCSRFVTLTTWLTRKIDDA